MSTMASSSSSSSANSGVFDKATEKLRSKHVRTLELLQRTLDENLDLRDKIAAFQKGKLHLGQGNTNDINGSGSGSNRIQELEEEILKLKLDQEAKILLFNDQQKEWKEKIDKNFNQQLEEWKNHVFSLENSLKIVRETQQIERQEFLKEKQRLLQEMETLKEVLLKHQKQQQEQQQQQQQPIEHTCSMNSTSTKLSTKEQQKIQEIQEKQEKQEKYLKKQIDLLQQELLCFQTKEKEYTIQNEYLKKQFDDFQFEFQQKQTIWQEETFFLRKQKQEVEKNIQLLQTLLESSKNEHNHTINQMNTKNQSIEEQNLFLQQELTRIKKELIDTYRKLDHQQQQQAVFTCGTGNTTTNTTNFGVHVDLKRENYQLKAQIEEMKALQKKYLTTAKKQTMKFPAI